MTLRALAGISTIAALLVTACATEEADTYGFVATLGNDTTSVERVTRTPTRIVSDAVGRSPVVVRRHWEADLAPDGTIRSWTMHTYMPNGPAGDSALHHTAEFNDSAVVLSRRVGNQTRNFAYTRTYAVTVPWNAYVYGTYEVLFDVARTRPDTTHIGQYFFEGWDETHIGFATVRKLGDDRYSIRSTGLAGAGVANMDANGRMLSYSGQGTTYKQEVVRIASAPDIDAIAARFAAEEKAKGVVRSLSTRDTARATLGATKIEIDYGRPLARGRKLVGGLIPYGEVWRTGANAATQLTVSTPITLGGVALDSGTYTLWTLPTQKDVKLIINRETGQWGTNYNPKNDIARVAVQVGTPAAPVERFTIRVEPERTPAGNSGAARAILVLEWGTFRWTVPVAAGARR